MHDRRSMKINEYDTRGDKRLQPRISGSGWIEMLVVHGRRIVRCTFMGIVFALLAACGGEDPSPPPDEVILTGDTARVPVLGTGDTRAGEIENIQWEQPEPPVREWLRANGFEHQSTSFDTDKMQAIGYETIVSEDQTGVRLFGISTWTQQADG